MKAMKDHVVVQAEESKSSVLIQQEALPQRGKVLAHGAVEEFDNKEINVIFGDQFDKIDIELDGEPASLLVMHKENIKLYFEV